MNNYFDGPFDQLPDNFIEGDTLRNAILKVQPNLKGQIDRFGGTPDGEVRYMIGPYLLYKEIGEFDARRPLRRPHARFGGRLLPLLYFQSRRRRICMRGDHAARTAASGGSDNPIAAIAAARSKETGRTFGVRPILSKARSRVDYQQRPQLRAAIVATAPVPVAATTLRQCQ